MKAPATLAERKRPSTTILTGAMQHAAVRPVADQATPQNARDGTRTPDLDHDFSQVPARTESAACTAAPTRCPFGGACHTCPVRVQTKLAMNQPDDEYEQEADRTAEEVVHTEATCLQRSAASQTEPTHVPPIVHQVLRSLGQPLDAATRALMEPRFGYDFSQVRVHADAKAAESARAVNALAYTVGQNIIFASGLYAPETTDGAELLAHELTHTLQQGSVNSQPQTASLRIVRADTRSEHEADTFARRMASGSATGNPPGAASMPYALHQSALQRRERSQQPLIPIPEFDELDPTVIVPDIEGVPGFLRGRQVKLSDLRKALEVLRGGLPGVGGTTSDICEVQLPGHETVQSGPLAGLCCPQFIRDRARCCTPQQIGQLTLRCCAPDEVVLNNRCFRPQPVPRPSVSPGREPPSVPRLELQFPRVRIGTIQVMTIDHFALDSASLPPDASGQLDRLASQINLHREAEIHVEGHTDSSFTPEYNQQLSEQRARVVQQALIARGVSAARLVVSGFGEERLRFPEERSAEEKASNRRVEVWLYIPPAEGLSEEFPLQPPSLTAP